MNRITPNNITVLLTGQVFVFGSNLSGRHGRGAAKTALKFGAIYGQGTGLQGNTYGIPTKNKSVTKSLTIDQIKPHIDTFIDFAKNNPQLTFLVTEIGCGLAGHKVKNMAPLFKEAINVENIWLPQRFWYELKNRKDLMDCPHGFSKQTGGHMNDCPVCYETFE